MSVSASWNASLSAPVKFRCRSVGPSVCLLVTSVYCGKMADSIEMPFGMVGRVGRKNYVLDRGSDTDRVKGIFFGGGAQYNMPRENVASVVPNG